MALVLACGGGGGDSGTGPVAVASVIITSPATAPTFGALTRTVQFAAEARDASNSPLAGKTITWSTSNSAVAAVTTSGLVTAAGNGTAQITASAEGKPSAPVTVTVAQVTASVAVTPPAVAFGAKGSTQQLAAAALDSTGHPISGKTATWTVTDAAVAAVSVTGLLTSVANGTAKAIGTIDGVADTADVTVAQVVNTITVTGSLLPDTLHTTGRTKQFAAAAADSNGNSIASVFTWLSTVPAIASVDGTGLVSAVSDGSTSIQASAGGKTGSRTMVVHRYAATFTLFPTAPQSITTAGGTLGFNGTAQDSVGTNLPISWLSRTTTVATVSPATGTSTTATAVGNGNTGIVMSGGTRIDSTQLTVTIPAAASAAVQIGDNFFKSVANNTQNPAVDTVAVGGTVTWTWVGAGSHSVASTGSPSFTSSTPAQSTGTYQFQFTVAGTYNYICGVHGAAMSGRVVVR